MKLFFALLIVATNLWAQVGEVVRGKARVERAGGVLELGVGAELELADVVSAPHGFLQLHIFPATQINLNSNSKIVISESMITEVESRSVVQLIEGGLRLLMEKLDGKAEQKVEARDASFAVRGTEFEVDLLDDGEELEVFEGEVEVVDRKDNQVVERIGRERRVKWRKGKLENRRALKRARRLDFKKQTELREMWQSQRLKRKERNDRADRRRERRERKKR